jgi:alkanesulfonate monooxygenase SsuD/methylene tetrahydromethanopterin reductase-like flavin-dependent oxidoreductase (luciferase family)
VIRLSVQMPVPPDRPGQALPFAALVRDGLADRLWQGQSLRIEPHQMFAYLAAAGCRIPVGIGVTLMPLRHPFESALHAASLATTVGAPIVAGFGCGAAALQASLRGAPYPSPLTAVREYLTVVRGLLAGGPVDHRGAYFHCRAMLPPMPGTRVEIGLGVLRRRMARVAGALADVAITWLAPPGYLAAEVVPALAEGARAAGRARPRLVAVVPVSLAAPGRDPIALTFAATWAHLSMPHYRAMLRRAGVDVDSPAAASALLDARACMSGSLADIAESVAVYEAAGVDEIVLNPAGVAMRYGLDAAAAELRTILTALPPLAPALAMTTTKAGR